MGTLKHIKYGLFDKVMCAAFLKEDNRMRTTVSSISYHISHLRSGEYLKLNKNFWNINFPKWKQTEINFHVMLRKKENIK